MDISRSEQVETDLDRLIERRDTERRKSEGERLEEVLWAESVRRYNASQEADHRLAWFEYEMRLYRIHSGLAAEHLARAERLESERRGLLGRLGVLEDEGRSQPEQEDEDEA